jgi:DNA (cytosine-5)-methyltransferase 1
MTFGSLFAGLGGMDLGLEMAGLTCAWQVEINPYCRRVLAKHWPNVRRPDDVRDFPAGRPDDWRADVIAGGFPCQDVSVANPDAIGIDGERSGLWSEFARVVRVLRPRYVVVENTPGLLVRGADRVLGDLAGLGYDAEWGVLPAAVFGLDHRRSRVFVVAYPGGERLPGDFGGILAAGQPLARHLSRRDCDGSGYPAGTVSRCVPRCGGKRDGLPGRVERTTALGNAVCPVVAEHIGRRLMAA